MPVLRVLLDWADALADRPGTSDDQRLKNRFLILTALGMSFGGILWGAMLGALGLWTQSAVPFGYVVITAFNIGWFYRRDAFRIATNVQVGISILLPFLLQWSLGGFVASGGTMVWAFVSTIAAQSLAVAGRSTRWWVLLVGLIAVSAAIETSLPVPPLLRDPAVSAIAFAVNFGMVGSLMFALSGYFLHLQHEWGLELADKNRQLAESQRALMHADRLAALGRLSAGLAHEMNNPAAAVRRGAAHLHDAVEVLWRVRFELGRAGLDAGQLARVRALESDVERRLRDAEPLDTMERAGLEQDLEDWVDDNGIDGVSDPAALAECGFTTDELDSLAADFDRDTLGLLLRQQCAWQTTTALLQELGAGAERISTLVNALKSYTYLDQAPVQAVDVNEGLRTTLVMLRSELKRGVTVRRHLDEGLPRIDGSGVELNQVWTNLIDNAVAAMDGEGELEVRTTWEDGAVVVRIIDSGPGIPESIRDRLFDPFVTTKPVGEGTGLGLNISRNIVVEKHGGTIEVDSRPGRTCFEVRIPAPEPARHPVPVGGGAGEDSRGLP